ARGGVPEIGIVRFASSTGESYLAAPGIALPLCALDEEQLGSVFVRREYDGNGGPAYIGGCVGQCAGSLVECFFEAHDEAVRGLRYGIQLACHGEVRGRGSVLHGSVCLHPAAPSVGHAGDVVVAHLLQGVGGEGGPVAAGAVDNDFAV